MRRYLAISTYNEPSGNQRQLSIRGRGEQKNFALKLTLTIFLRQICEFHKIERKET